MESWDNRISHLLILDKPTLCVRSQSPIKHSRCYQDLQHSYAQFANKLKTNICLSLLIQFLSIVYSTSHASCFICFCISVTALLQNGEST